MNKVNYFINNTALTGIQRSLKVLGRSVPSWSFCLWGLLFYSYGRG